MARFKKRWLAVATAILLAAGVLTGLLAFLHPKTSVPASAYEVIATEEQYNQFLEFGSDGSVQGFKQGVELPANISLTLPANKEIASGAFEACKQLIRVEIPEAFSAEYIGENAFRECTRLVEIATQSDQLTAETLESASASLQLGGIAYYALNIHEGGNTALTSDGDCLFIADTVKGTAQTEYLIGADEIANGDLELPAHGGTEYAVYNYAFHQQADIRTVTVEAGAKISEIGRLAFYQCPDLETVDLSGGDVAKIADSAFLGCAGLNSLTLSAALTQIEGYAFSGCSGLTAELTIPASVASIGTNAFTGCSSLAGVTFEDGEQPLAIASSAFNGCSSLAVIELPNRLTELGVNSFTGCTNLSTVYFNSQVTFLANPTPGVANAYFGSNTLIIFDTAASYKAAIADGSNASVHKNRMTFLVTLTFEEVGETVGAESEVAQLVRLYNNPYNFTQNADKSWSLVTESSVPVQDGYSKSVWYTNETTTALADFDTLLGSTESESVTLYAKRIAKPALTAQTLTYDAGTTYSISNTGAFLDKTLDGTVYEMKILKGTAVQESGVQDAGDYTFVANLKNEAMDGKWASDVEIAFSINRKPVNILALIEWQVDGHGLIDGTIYVYENASGDEVYSSTVLTNPEGLTYRSALTLKNSIVRYADGSGLTVALKADTENSFEIGAYTDATQTAEGRHESSVTIDANPNYLFRNFGDTADDTDAARGVTVQINDDRTQATVSKVWYIVSIGNHLVKDSATNAAYTISGWTFGETDSGKAPAAPVLRYGTEETLNNTTFTVKMGTAQLSGTYYLVKGTHAFGFEDVVNLTMPAGTYELTFSIPATGDYPAATDTVSFTVAKAAFDSAWVTAVENSFVTLNTSSDNSLKLLTVADLNGWDAKVPAVTPTGIWANESGYYDTDFELTYNFAGEQNNTYRPENQIEGYVNNEYLPKGPGTYTVYYNFTAQNYEPLVDTATADRTQYRFTVVLFRIINVPTVADLVYTGNRMLPLVTEGEEGTRNLYSITYETAENSYVNAGNHTVTVTLNDAEHYKWGGEGQDAAKVLTFTILRADNNDNLPLSVSSWTRGNFNPELHHPVWSTVFNDPADANFYTFILISEDGKTTYAYSEFVSAPIGSYTLRAIAKGYVQGDASTEHYNWNQCVRETTVRINVGVNTWAVTPNVMQWEFGSYVKDVNLILAQPTIQEEDNPVVFKITYDAAGKNVVEGLESFSLGEDGLVSGEVAAVLAGLRVSSYYLWSEVASTAEYEGIPARSGFEFKVTKSENYWDEAPTISTWIVGSYDDKENTISAKPHFGGTVSYKIVLVGDEEKVVFDSSNGLNELKTAGVGVYELRASVAGTDDYADLFYTLTFRIFEKAGLAWWAILLIVLAALALVALVFFILHQKGVLQLLTGKVVLAMRTRATVDATIAAVRANKVAEDAKQSLADAEAKEAAEARRKLIEETKSRPLDERAEVLEELAREEAERADKMQKRADDMYLTAEKMRKRANKTRENLENNETLEDTEEPTDPTGDDNAEE